MSQTHTHTHTRERKEEILYFAYIQRSCREKTKKSLQIFMKIDRKKSIKKMLPRWKRKFELRIELEMKKLVRWCWRLAYEMSTRQVDGRRKRTNRWSISNCLLACVGARNQRTKGRQTGRHSALSLFIAFSSAILRLESSN